MLPKLALLCFCLVPILSGTAPAEPDGSPAAAEGITEVLFGTTVFRLDDVRRSEAVAALTLRPDGEAPEQWRETLTLLEAPSGDLAEWVTQTRRGLETIPGLEITEIPNQRTDRQAFQALFRQPETGMLESHLYYFSQESGGQVRIFEYAVADRDRRESAFLQRTNRLLPVWLRELASIDFPAVAGPVLGADAALAYRPFDAEPIAPVELLDTGDGARYQYLEVDHVLLATFGAAAPPAHPFRIALPRFLNPSVTGAPIVPALLHLSWVLPGGDETLIFTSLGYAGSQVTREELLPTIADRLEAEVVRPFLARHPVGTFRDRYQTRIGGNDAIVLTADFEDKNREPGRIDAVAILVPDQPEGVLVLWIRPPADDGTAVGRRVLHSFAFLK